MEPPEHASSRSIQEVATKLGTSWLGRPLKVVGTIASTMDVARAWSGSAAGDEPMPHGAVVVALGQTQGRGRRGRSWHSPPGLGLYLSALLRPPLSPVEIAPLGPAAGLAVADALGSFVPRAVRVKWPNDVRIGGYKVAGVLAHAESRLGRIERLVLGVGVNVLHRREDFPPALRKRATSLALAGGGAVEPATLLGPLLEALERRIDAVLNGRFEELVDEWNAACDHLGRTVAIAEGARKIEGRAIGIDATGRLRVLAGDGEERRVGAGELIE